MSRFVRLDADQPATLGAVVEAVIRLSTYDEARMLELASAGRIQELFPFGPDRPDDIGPDFVDEKDLIEASPAPLSRKGRAMHLEASLPAHSNTQSRADTKRRRRRFRRR
jgi:hypothetical protein